MRIHYIQHVPFENLSNIENWITNKKHSLTPTKLYENQELPDMDSFDFLIILGGSMNIYDEEKYSSLRQEKQFIKEAIQANKYILGICLGAQLLADALGAEVTNNNCKEIGWFPVSFKKTAQDHILFKNIPSELNVFHWHGDTFDIPPNCKNLASSKACANQGFVYEDRVVGLQFHLESSKESVEKLTINCGDEIIESNYVQNAEYMVNYNGFDELKSHLHSFLNNFEELILQTI